MRKGCSDTAAIQVDNPAILAARNDHTAAESVAAFAADQAGSAQQFGRITQGSQMSPEVPAGSIADAEFFDDGEIPQSAAFQIAHRFRTAMELKLIEGSRVFQQLNCGDGAYHRCHLLPQMRDALTEWHVEKEFYKANQIATLPTSMAVEQVSAGIDIEGRARIPVQWAKPYKLLPGAATTGSPVMSQQIIKQWEMLFELFQVRIQGFVSSRNRDYEVSDRFPRQGWWVGKLS